MTDAQKESSVGQIAQGIAACVASPILLVAFAASAGAWQHGDVVFNSVRPMDDLRAFLEAKYGEPVTLEEPFWPEHRAGQGRDGRPPSHYALDKYIRLVVPANLLPEDLSGLHLAHLKQILALYNRDGLDPVQFDAVPSEWGLHIVPVAIRTENGEIVKVSSPLDLPVHVEEKRQMASEHLRALCQALGTTMGAKVGPGGWYLDGWFAAGGLVPPKHATALLSEKEREPYTFPWGVERATARSALISLLKLSSSTLSWNLLCRDDRGMVDGCFLNCIAPRVWERDEQGKPVLDENGQPRLRYKVHDRLHKIPLKAPPIRIQ